jgi:hypothetical protein
MSDIFQKLFGNKSSYFKNLEKKCNANRFHPYKINGLIFRSQECLDELKKIVSIEDIQTIQSKLHNDNMLNYLYNRWNPTFIYVTLHEIYVFKFYEEDDHYTLPYNGNINKNITTLSSGLSLATNLEFSASYIEFDDDSDIYEYVLLKQKECYRNYLNIVWSRLLKPNNLNGVYPSMTYIEEYIKNGDLKESDNHKNGIFIKHVSSKNLSKDWTIMNSRDIKNKFVYFTSKF